MPQFAIYKNPGRNGEIPFVVQIQSSRMDKQAGRVVMPLVRRSAGAPPDHGLTPHLKVLGIKVYANPFDLATIAAARLTDALGVLPEAAQDRIIQAIDDMTSRA